ncbi:sensor histidine kinase [Pelistega europaea]|uniref:histidine kinase n=1 Tax=Pelistega europaea TaxID=106147 RepID=A0A7Y4LAC0_9BURK|nr:ATP-binding protein [Pelistega europaea]NOL48757.1 HAMP domain-containing protein [Pelistega europaea]
MAKFHFFESKAQLVLKWILRISLFVAVIAVFFLLALLIGSAGNTSRFAEQFDILLLLNGVLALALFIWVFSLVVGLVKQVRRKKFGAKLTSRFAFFFAMIAIVPGVIIYLLSVQFMSRSVESWFNVKVDSALESGLTLGQASLDSMLDDLVASSRRVAFSLGNVTDSDMPAALARLRDDNQNTDMLVFSSNGSKVIAFASSTFGSLLPQIPSANLLGQLRLSRQYASAEEVFVPGGDKDRPKYQLRVIVPLFSTLNRLDTSLSGNSEPHWLQLTRMVPESFSNNLNEIQLGYRNYEELALSRGGLRQLFSITLTMALLLTVFVSLGIALWLAKRLVEPLLTLAEGTQAVAAGDYCQIPEPKQSDEVGQLSRSFNMMTSQLEEARRQVQNNRIKLERSNLYLESILASLTTGVMVLDQLFYVQRVNKGAQAILHKSLADFIGQPLDTLPHLQEFAQVIRRAFASHAAVGSSRLYWQEQIELRLDEDDGQARDLTLLLRGTHLTSEDNKHHYLLVFDDISDIISANRAVAWGEVARRLAHEIKNPLTPIQLSAERIQMKLSPKLDEQDAQFLERLTNTIVNQVFSLKTMVDDFREYARTPPAQFQAVNVNELIMDLALLYGWTPEGNHEELLYRQLRLELDDNLPLVEADATQLRQVLNNLLSNARDAMEGMELTGDEPGVTIQTQCTHIEGGLTDDNCAVRITIRDRGPGFPSNILQKAFEPYVTTKPHGTGLGLAIVRKIVEEHHGKIEIANTPEGGAKISILLSRIVKT